MRKVNPNRMTVVEQLVSIREATCDYACKHKERVEQEQKDPLIQKVVIQGYCHDCPLAKVHYIKEGDPLDKYLQGYS